MVYMTHEVQAVKAYVRPRPIRVAYLVEESEHWQTLLDAIFAESFARWGGRFTLIVPCENGAIRPAYVPWLQAYDADIIYSYVDLSDAVVERLHEKFGPSFLAKHDFHRREERDRYAYQPHLPVAPLSVLSVTAAMTRGGMISAPQPVAMVDTHLGTQPSLFLQQNFGCYGQSLRPWPVARDMGDYLKPVIFVPPEVQANPRLMPRAEGEIVSSEKELIERIAGQRDLRGLAQMSASFAPRLEFGDMAWSRTVNFVVGDSFVDRLIFWNALHLTPVWLDGGIAAFKVSKDDLDDTDRFNAIVNIIKNRVYLPVGGNASHAHIVLRSASLSASELEQIAVRLKAANSFNAYTSEHIASIDALVPSASALEQARQHVEPGSPFQPRDWHEVTFGENAFRPPIVLPRHLRDAPQLPPGAKQGLWQLDLDIERAVDHSGVQNVQHHWRLPRRLRMISAFTRGYQLHSMSAVCMPRATAGGLLSLPAGSTERCRRSMFRLTKLSSVTRSALHATGGPSSAARTSPSRDWCSICVRPTRAAISPPCCACPVIYIGRRRYFSHGFGRNGLSCSARRRKQRTNDLRRLRSGFVSDSKPGKSPPMTSGGAWPTWCSPKLVPNAFRRAI
jgi:hypothetical protein